jgi:hypothetical protein
LIDLYGKCHYVDGAARVFEGIQESDKDLYSWNSMLSALQYSAHHAGTMRLFAQMRRAAVWPDALTVAGLLLSSLHAHKLLHFRLGGRCMATL